MPLLLTIRCQDNKDYVYFHSGSEATYRKVADNPSSFTSIPTIDLAELDSPSSDIRKRIAKSIYNACSQCGFFYIENHGVPQHVITETLDLLKRFFALDLDAKMDAHVQKNPAIRGYEPMLETRNDPRTKGGKCYGPQSLWTTTLTLSHRYQRGVHDGRLRDRTGAGLFRQNRPTATPSHHQATEHLAFECTMVARRPLQVL